MKLSIILTVYNKESFLEDSLNALTNQENSGSLDYEVLVVDDGSTDGSSGIIDSYVKKDSRIRKLSQSNLGLSMARNNGTLKAKGDYIWYVDADDKISSNAVRLICEKISQSPDVISFYAKTDGIDKIRNQLPLTLKSGKEVLICNQWHSYSPRSIHRHQP